MTLLSNLLLYGPGHSGFSSYVKRVIPAIPGMRLLVDGPKGAVCYSGGILPIKKPTKGLGHLARMSLTQHGINVRRTLTDAGIKIADVEAVYSPFCDFLFELPAVNQIITCHDLTPLYYANSRRATWRYRIWTPVHLRRAQQVIAISRYVADQLIGFGLPVGKISVVPNGIETVGKAQLDPGGLDLLMVARHDGNKNVTHAVKGFAHFMARNPGWSGNLRIVGRQGPRTTEVCRAIRELDVKERVELVEFVSQDQLEELMGRSLALISSSWMEGFNYPVLEAMAKGLPCLISDIPVHRELYQDAALLFSLKDNGEDLAVKLQDMVIDPSLWRGLASHGMSRAQRFSLKKQQRSILTVITSTIGLKNCFRLFT